MQQRVLALARLTLLVGLGVSATSAVAAAPVASGKAPTTTEIAASATAAGFGLLTSTLTPTESPQPSATPTGSPQVGATPSPSTVPRRVCVPPIPSPTPTFESVPPIVIEEIVPASAPPWSYVELSGLLPPSNFTVWFNGVDAPPFYLTRVNEMSTYTVRVIVPWDATSGPVTVGFYGTISTAYEFTVDPVDVKPEDIVPGVMSALFAPGADVPAIVAAMGNDPASVECSGLCTELGCWYGVDFTPGTEVSQSILYTRHPDVVWAQPVPVVLLEPGGALPNRHSHR